MSYFEALEGVLRPKLEAIERLLIGASVGSCVCGVKTPDIEYHAAHCRYVTLQYALALTEDALGAFRLAKGGAATSPAPSP